MGNCLKNLLGKNNRDVIQIDLNEFPNYIDKNKTAGGEQENST